ncbi:titin homolog [Euwallacea fornicatus]|uniref:titin homolog n=1 Tax=Euwallacea fornicatus TaxID=995702 RepID=UPI00338DD51F
MDKLGYLCFALNGKTIPPYEFNVGLHTIGTTTDCNVRLKCRDKSMADIHAVIKVDSLGVAIIVNKNNREPLKLNGRSLFKQSVLCHGDKIEIGDKTFQYFNEHLKSVPKNSSIYTEALKNFNTRKSAGPSARTHSVRTPPRSTEFPIVSRTQYNRSFVTKSASKLLPVRKNINVTKVRRCSTSVLNQRACRTSPKLNLIVTENFPEIENACAGSININQSTSSEMQPSLDQENDLNLNTLADVSENQSEDFIHLSLSSASDREISANLSPPMKLSNIFNETTQNHTVTPCLENPLKSLSLRRSSRLSCLQNSVFSESTKEVLHVSDKQDGPLLSGNLMASSSSLSVCTQSFSSYKKANKCSETTSSFIDVAECTAKSLPSENNKSLPEMFNNTICTSTPFPNAKASFKVNRTFVSSDKNSVSKLFNPPKRRSSLRLSVSKIKKYDCASCRYSSRGRSLSLTKDLDKNSSFINKKSILSGIENTPDKVLKEESGDTPKSHVKLKKLSYNPQLEDITPVTPEQDHVTDLNEEMFKTPVNSPGLFENIKKSVVRSRKRLRESYGSTLKENCKRRRVEILKEKGSPSNRISNYIGLKKLMRTPPRSPRNDLRNVPNLRKFVSPKQQHSPKNDLENVPNLKKFMSPRQQRSPKNDLKNIPNLRRFVSPKHQRSPKNDLENVPNLRKYMSPKQQRTPKNDLDQNASAVADFYNLSGVEVLHNSSDIENSDDLFTQLTGKGPIKSYHKRGKSLGSDSPSRRVQQWVDEQQTHFNELESNKRGDFVGNRRKTEGDPTVSKAEVKTWKGEYILQTASENARSRRGSLSMNDNKRFSSDDRRKTVGAPATSGPNVRAWKWEHMFEKVQLTSGNRGSLPNTRHSLKINEDRRKTLGCKTNTISDPRVWNQIQSIDAAEENASFEMSHEPEFNSSSELGNRSLKLRKTKARLARSVSPKKVDDFMNNRRKTLGNQTTAKAHVEIWKRQNIFQRATENLHFRYGSLPMDIKNRQSLSSNRRKTMGYKDTAAANIGEWRRVHLFEQASRKFALTTKRGSLPFEDQIEKRGHCRRKTFGDAPRITPNIEEWTVQTVGNVTPTLSLNHKASFHNSEQVIDSEISPLETKNNVKDKVVTPSSKKLWFNVIHKTTRTKRALPKDDDDDDDDIEMVTAKRTRRQLKRNNVEQTISIEFDSNVNEKQTQKRTRDATPDQIDVVKQPEKKPEKVTRGRKPKTQNVVEYVENAEEEPETKKVSRRGHRAGQGKDATQEIGNSEQISAVEIEDAKGKKPVRKGRKQETQNIIEDVENAAEEHRTKRATRRGRRAEQEKDTTKEVRNSGQTSAVETENATAKKPVRRGRKQQAQKIVEDIENATEEPETKRVTRRAGQEKYATQEIENSEQTPAVETEDPKVKLPIRRGRKQETQNIIEKIENVTEEPEVKRVTRRAGQGKDAVQEVENSEQTPVVETEGAKFKLPIRRGRKQETQSVVEDVENTSEEPKTKRITRRNHKAKQEKVATEEVGNSEQTTATVEDDDTKTKKPIRTGRRQEKETTNKFEAQEIITKRSTRSGRKQEALTASEDSKNTGLTQIEAEIKKSTRRGRKPEKEEAPNAMNEVVSVSASEVIPKKTRLVRNMKSRETVKKEDSNNVNELKSPIDVESNRRPIRLAAQKAVEEMKTFSPRPKRTQKEKSSSSAVTFNEQVLEYRIEHMTSPTIQVKIRTLKEDAGSSPKLIESRGKNAVELEGNLPTENKPVPKEKGPKN